MGSEVEEGRVWLLLDSGVTNVGFVLSVCFDMWRFVVGCKLMNDQGLLTRTERQGSRVTAYQD